MKVPPKRKGNGRVRESRRGNLRPLNESPSEKEGKYITSMKKFRESFTLNESPSEKEGKSVARRLYCRAHDWSLNESPSEKEGK